MTMIKPREALWRIAAIDVNYLSVCLEDIDPRLCGKTIARES